MGNQWVEARPAFGLVEAHHGVRVRGIAGEAVDGLSRHGDEAAAAQVHGGELERSLLDRHDSSHALRLSTRPARREAGAALTVCVWRCL